ncbi:ORF52 [Alcelaphine gammaherpesvirus 1]|uniref:Uncharacterized gene 52 protein n=1 Tax=Alcelaphine herpesvirus 1 (strain C500) TaxID=654901 RepID=VG52_ALHV1|nr:ORF52 [Alcelaphine gammaherpesvirus 1]O36402.1 RecName: Full=Uncharacterized gene 52 protein [Alcelaphine herpesvirus 1 strain C500]AAC58099.1 ORF52 [Alcelaphine gammaherpesvirus 1]APB09475.1 virion protein G52 [Alcelaphine gammaherpesvirus 1]APB09547.1 virion protein G52 [Alcelaphine gammaherpesvirus 1]ATI21938.1 ORF52 [Alcelaphine gammaherpesvirus 1]QDY92284.1 virion protein G52 [Alcelaphine gammaherpesvirus 1]
MDPKNLTVEQLAAELTKLQMENSHLKRKLRRSVGGPPKEPPKPRELTEPERQLVLARWHNRFSSRSSELLRRQLDKLTATLVTEEDIDEVLKNADFRLHFRPDPSENPEKKLSKEKRRTARGQQQ